MLRKGRTMFGSTRGGCSWRGHGSGPRDDRRTRASRQICVPDLRRFSWDPERQRHREQEWSPRPGSNRRPLPYQGSALPTELRGPANGPRNAGAALRCDGGQGGNRTPTVERRLIYSQRSSPPAQPTHENDRRVVSRRPRRVYRSTRAISTVTPSRQGKIPVPASTTSPRASTKVQWMSSGRRPRSRRARTQVLSTTRPPSAS